MLRPPERPSPSTWSDFSPPVHRARVGTSDAAKNFSDILNAVEHRGEHFTIVRRGKVVAERSKVSLDELIDDEDEVAVAAITVAELLVGVLLADGGHQADGQHFVDEVKQTIPIVDYDATIAAAHAELLVAVRRQGQPRGAHDLIIGATANATQREVVTSDDLGYDDLPGVIVRSHRS